MEHSQDRADRFWSLPLLLFPGLKLGLHLVTWRGYGIFRDELYYIACSQRLAAGYVDHPPFSVLVLRLVRELLGDSLWSLRLVPALLGAATVLLVGLMAREMGGGRFAQALAMSAALAAPMYLGINHTYSMNSFDIFFWAATAFVMIRLLKGASPRLWIGLGVLLGLGLQNKISVLWLGFGLAVGLACTSRRRDLLSRWPWLGGAAALVLFLPHVLWQAALGWPTLEFIRNATQNKMATTAPLDFVVGQVLSMGPINAVVWIAGLIWLFVAAGGRFRLLGWTYLAVLALLASSGSSRDGYLAPAYTWLLAAGGVALAPMLGRLGTWARVAALALVLAAGAALAPFGVPILPIDDYVAYARRMGVGPSTDERKELARLPQFYADMRGWESIVATVSDVHRQLSPEDRAHSIVFAYNYGVAGAVEHLGRRYSLPAAFSGHNNYWLWGPPPDSARVVIVVGGDLEGHRAHYDEVREAARTDCGDCMPYENHNPIFVCKGPKTPWHERWPRMKHFD